MASAGSSCAISSSILPHSATARVAACDRNAGQPGLRRGPLDVGADLRDVGFVEIDHEQQRLGREELKAAQPLQIVAGERQRAQRPALFERGLALLHDVALLLELRRSSLLQIALDALEPPLGDAEVGEEQLVFHRLRVARRIHRARRMRHRLVAKRAHDVHERVGVLVVGHVHERLRAAGLGHHRDVGELHGGRHALLRVVHPGEHVEPIVGDLRDPDLDVALAARSVAGAGHELKEGGLSAGGEPDQRGAKHERFSLARDGQGVGWSEADPATGCGEDTKKRKYRRNKTNKTLCGSVVCD